MVGRDEAAPSDGSRPMDWIHASRAASRPRVSVLFFLVAAVSAASSLGLSMSLRFPEVLLDDRTLATSLVDANMVSVLLSLASLLARGLLLVLLVRELDSLLPGDRRRLMSLSGSAAGVCYAAGAVLGLVLVPLWASNVIFGVDFLARTAFLCTELAAPLLASVWTVSLIRYFHSARIIGVLSALALLTMVMRSTVWVVNTMLPEGDGLYLASALLTVVALLGYPIWICWLIRMGVLLKKHGEQNGSARTSALAVAKRIGAGLVGAVFVAAYAGAILLNPPAPKSPAVPSVPSVGGDAVYVFMMALKDTDLFALPTTYPELIEERQDDFFTRPEVPSYADLRTVDADGIQAEYICAAEASDDRVVLYIPGGGFILPPSNGARAFAAAISRESGACVLMPHYRLAPEHPFPAALGDCVRAYHWLRDQGVAASRIVIMGDSAGANLTLTTALALRDGGEELPAASISLSPITDFTLSGETFRTKADRDPLLTSDTVKYTVQSYTDNGAVDLRDPLLSPLFADLEGLPPTLLMVGSQEVLLSDSIRMAGQLRADGVPTKLEIWPGMPHAWYSAVEGLMEYRLTIRHISDFITMVGNPSNVDVEGRNG